MRGCVWLLLVGCGRISFDNIATGDGGGDGNGDGGMTASVCNRISRVADDFADGTRSIAYWRRAYMDPGATTAEQGGDLVITLASNTASTYAGYVSSHAYDLRGDRLAVEIAAQPVAPAEIGMAAAFDNANHVSIGIRGNTMYMGAKLNNTFMEYAQTSYSLATQRFLAISERGGRLYWETSMDGMNWTVFHEQAPPIDVSSLLIHVYAGTFDPQASPGAARIAAINPGAIAAPGCPVSALTDDFEDGALLPQWDELADPCCTAVETGGGLHISTNGVSGGAQRMSRSGYNLTGGELTVRVPTGPSTSSQFAARIYAYVSATDELDFRIDNTTIVARTIINGTPNNVSAARAGTEAYLRIRETSGMVFFETSPDRMVWSQVHVLATPFAVDDIEIRLQGSANTATIADTFTFDDVNR